MTYLQVRPCFFPLILDLYIPLSSVHLYMNISQASSNCDSLYFLHRYSCRIAGTHYWCQARVVLYSSLSSSLTPVQAKYCVFLLSAPQILTLVLGPYSETHRLFLDYCSSTECSRCLWALLHTFNLSCPTFPQRLFYYTYWLKNF